MSGFLNKPISDRDLISMVRFAAQNQNLRKSVSSFVDENYRLYTLINKLLHRLPKSNKPEVKVITEAVETSLNTISDLVNKSVKI